MFPGAQAWVQKAYHPRLNPVSPSFQEMVLCIGRHDPPHFPPTPPPAGSLKNLSQIPCPPEHACVFLFLSLPVSWPPYPGMHSLAAFSVLFAGQVHSVTAGGLSSVPQSLWTPDTLPLPPARISLNKSQWLLVSDWLRTGLEFESTLCLLSGAGSGVSGCRERRDVVCGDLGIPPPPPPAREQQKRDDISASSGRCLVGISQRSYARRQVGMGSSGA